MPDRPRCPSEHPIQLPTTRKSEPGDVTLPFVVKVCAADPTELYVAEAGPPA